MQTKIQNFETLTVNNFFVPPWIFLIIEKRTPQLAPLYIPFLTTFELYD